MSLMGNREVNTPILQRGNVNFNVLTGGVDVQ